MLLPNHAEAIIPVEKLRDYLLDLNHVDGGPEALLLYRMGFVRERWWELDAGLREMIATYDAMDSPGYPERRFIVRGQLHGPKESHLFRTVWALGQGAVAPRFLSAYPR